MQDIQQFSRVPSVNIQPPTPVPTNAPSTSPVVSQSQDTQSQVLFVEASSSNINECLQQFASAVQQKTPASQDQTAAKQQQTRSTATNVAPPEEQYARQFSPGGSEYRKQRTENSEWQMVARGRMLQQQQTASPSHVQQQQQLAPDDDAPSNQTSERNPTSGKSGCDKQQSRHSNRERSRSRSSRRSSGGESVNKIDQRPRTTARKSDKSER